MSSGVRSEALNSVFIGGCPRSGTTMLGSILGSAKGCVVTPESHFKQTVLLSMGSSLSNGFCRDELLAKILNSFRFKIWEIPAPAKAFFPEVLMPQDCARLFYALVAKYAKKHGVSDWNTWVDHTPQNIQNPLMLTQIFPNSRFIHMVRDPRAVAASVLPLDWGPDTAEDAAIFWAQKLSYGLALEQVYADRCLRVYYEDIVRDPERVIFKIAKFCDIEFDMAMLDGSAFKVPLYTQKQHGLVGCRPDPNRLDSWKTRLDMWQIQSIERVLGDLMKIMGYSCSIERVLPRRPITNVFVSGVTPVVSFLKKKRFSLKKKFYGHIHK